MMNKNKVLKVLRDTEKYLKKIGDGYVSKDEHISCSDAVRSAIKDMETRFEDYIERNQRDFQEENIKYLLDILKDMKTVISDTTDTTSPMLIVDLGDDLTKLINMGINRFSGFQINHCYRHKSDGNRMRVLHRADTSTYGLCFIVELNSFQGFTNIDTGSETFSEWEEISMAEFLPA